MSWSCQFFRSDILNQLCYEKRELYSAMAWLSTLGGAFSALGDISSDYVSYISKSKAVLILKNLENLIHFIGSRGRSNFHSAIQNSLKTRRSTDCRSMSVVLCSKSDTMW